MQVSQIVKLINQTLADELCSPAELLSYMDRVIDDINTRLNAKFPTVSEVIAMAGGTTDPDYNMFPDKYIRSVLVTGAAYDYSFSIPEIYREDNQGFVTDSDKDVGIWFPTKFFD